MLSSTFMRAPEASRRMEWVAQVLILVLAAALLFWNLSVRYLWQDEAQTAVMAQRMVRFGKPLAYDGTNFLSLDMLTHDPDDVLRRRTASAQATIEYYRQRHAYKPDTAWIWHPWGFFVLPALSFRMFGPTTFAARLPFAIAGLVTVFLLFRLARRWCGGVLPAAVASLLLVLNPYWILHARQCRYYAISSMFLVLALVSYMRWRQGLRWGAVAFVTVAWCWFQMDYGTVWPVLAVLFADSLLRDGRRFRETLLVGIALAAALIPFVYYYELWGRGSQGSGFAERFRVNLFQINEYVAPVLVLLAASALLLWRRSSLGSAERRLITVSCAIVGAMMLWVPAVSEYPYLRYVIVITPLAALVTGWTAVRFLGVYAGRFAWLALALLVCVPWLSLPLRILGAPAGSEDLSPMVRTEWSYLYANLFGHRADPNRLVIEWLRQNAAPTDEILINYEDLPLIFYLPNPIRGGVVAFRAEDDATVKPRFLILRHSVDFVYWPAFEREQARYRWQQVPLAAPDIPWGNNPDPMGQDDPREAPPLYLARRADP